MGVNRGGEPVWSAYMPRPASRPPRPMVPATQPTQQSRGEPRLSAMESSIERMRGRSTPPSSQRAEAIGATKDRLGVPDQDRPESPRTGDADTESDFSGRIALEWFSTTRRDSRMKQSGRLAVGRPWVKRVGRMQRIPASPLRRPARSDSRARQGTCHVSAAIPLKGRSKVHQHVFTANHPQCRRAGV
jgi:hypothetical protein